MAIEALDFEIKHNANGADNAVDHLVDSLGKLRDTLTGIAGAIKYPMKASEALGNLQRVTAATAQKGRAAVAAAQAESESLDLVQYKYRQTIELLGFYSKRVQRMRDWESEYGATETSQSTIASDLEKIAELSERRKEIEAELAEAQSARAGAEEGVASASRDAASAADEEASSTERLADAVERANEARSSEPRVKVSDEVVEAVIDESTAYERLQNSIDAAFKSLRNALSVEEPVQTKVDSLAASLQRMYQQLDLMQEPMEGPIDIDAIVEESTELDRLSNKLAEVRAALEYSLQGGDAKTHIDSLIETIQRLNAEMDALRGESAPPIISDEEVLRVYESSTAFDRLTHSIEAAWEELRSALAEGSPQTQIDSIIERIGRLSEKLEEMQTASEDAAEGIKEIADAGPGVADSIKRATSGFERFFKMVGRMALYRAIRSAIMGVAKSVKEGVENFKAWDEATGQMTSANVARTLNEYNASFTQLKNSIGAAASPILQAFLPAIRTLVSWLTAAINAINAFFRALAGFSTFFAASAIDMDSFTDSTNAAGGAASKLKNTILGFDELNVMDEPNSGGGGGGGGSSGADGIGEFVELDIPDKIKEIISKVGELQQAFDDFWNSDAMLAIRGAVKTLMSGLITQALAWIEFKIESLTLMLETLAKFFNGDFAGGLEGLLDTDLFNLRGLVDLLGGNADLGSKTLYKLLFGDYESSPQWLQDAVGLMNWISSYLLVNEESGGLLIQLETLRGFVDAVKELKEYFSDHTLWDYIFGKDVPDTLDTLLSGFSFVDKIKEWFTNTSWGDVASDLGDASLNLVDSIFGGWDRAGKRIWDGISEAVVGYIKKNKNAVVEFPAKAANTATEWWSDIKEWFEDATSGDAVYFLAKVMDTARDWWSSVTRFWGTVKEKTVYFYARVKDEATTWWNDVVTWWRGTSVGKTAGTFTVGVLDTASSWWATVKTLWSAVTTGVNVRFKADVLQQATMWWTNVKTWWNAIPDKFVSFGVRISTVISDLWEEVKKAWNKAAGTLTTRLTISIPKINVSWENAILGIKKPVFSVTYPNGFAEGGFPETGQLFIANEAGPEYVGSIGGHTAVANTDQIIAGIATGVANAMMRSNTLLSEQNALLAEIADRDMTAVVSTHDVAVGMNRYNRRAGVTVMPTGA